MSIYCQIPSGRQFSLCENQCLVLGVPVDFGCNQNQSMSFRLNNGIGCVLLLSIVVGPGLLAAYLLHSAVWAFIVPIAMVGVLLCVAAIPSRRKISPQEFANELERHLDGTDNEDDWDRTSSVRISNRLLEQVRLSLSDRFDSLSTPQDREELRQIIEALRRGEFPGAGSNA